MTWHHISPGVTMKGFKTCCTFNSMDRTNDMLWNGTEEDGDISMKKMKALTAKMETETLIGQGR
jgi:hypothetical protein